MKILSDNHKRTIQEDEFGFSLYVDLLTDSIVDTDELPFTIGVFGDWGSGKSSLMSMIQSQLEANDYKTVWFNPWKYDQKEDLWNALIQSILLKISESKDDQLKNKAKSMAGEIAWMAIKKGAGILSQGFVTEHDFERLKTAYTKENELFYEHVNKFEDNFNKVVRTYGGDKKLIIFIDDLDRCMPENAITVLESLKLFLGESQCVFILGMDREIIEDGIAQRYDSKLKMSGKDYLEKIIQVPFYLPPVPFSQLKQSLRLTKSSNYSDDLWQMLEIGLDCNPRQTKRFVNSFYFLSNLLRMPEYNVSNLSDNYMVNLSEAQQTFLLAKLLILNMKHQSFYRYLIHHPEAWEYYERKVQGDEMSMESNEVIVSKEFVDFLSDNRLKLFMKATPLSNGSIPPPPAQVIESLLKMISLVDERNRNSDTHYQKMQATPASGSAEVK